jgi:hypothetical protein
MRTIQEKLHYFLIFFLKKINPLLYDLQATIAKVNDTRDLYENE